MTLIGFVWAIFAPALLIPLVWGVARLLKVLGVPPVHRRLPRLPLRYVLAGAVVLLPIATIYVEDKREFQAICAANAHQVVDPLQASEPVEGLYLDDGTANSFGMRYLETEGFRWMEAPSIYKPEGYTRYEKQPDGAIRATETDTLTAVYKVSSESAPVTRHTRVSRIIVSERETGKVLGSAASARFDGGRAKLVLGAYGSSSCPDPATSEGHHRFLAEYHLARNILRPGTGKP
ncbi:hypothetical protein LNV23_04420 [Paucibacter sp. DJ1R-11]|uniref:hypothetical protein n=1 Tax=Paucibacter sp. DJ1R-11 TaxID=2893556 RepID=UPI0021E4984A|nr:hypothetical protein [Paucibacter sp. DJ1R-11]MCV2362693.1 hypothetical protein [Paucibacter sp. DJ1R-11]